jgi:hypothetical protein
MAYEMEEVGDDPTFFTTPSIQRHATPEYPAASSTLAADIPQSFSSYFLFVGSICECSLAESILRADPFSLR